MLCTFALADNETIPVEVGPYPGKEEVNDEKIEVAVDLDEIIDAMVSNRIATYVPSETEYAKANEILDLYNTVNSGGNVTKHSTGSAYLENWKKLRYGNLIELTLDYDEGIDNLLVLRCTGYATDAKNDAVEYYPQYTDSAQHFMWNYLMTERVSKTVARTVGNNHEWGIAMINSMLNAYDGYYNKYLKEGMSE